MSLNRSKLLLIAIALLSIILGSTAFVIFRKEVVAQENTRFDEFKVDSLINDFRNSHKSLFIIELMNTWYTEFPKELYDGSNVIPNPTRYTREDMAVVLQAGAACDFKKLADPHLSKNINYKKMIQWYKFKCGKVKLLDQSLWQQAPMIHPLGGTWTYWLYQNKYGDKDWLEKERKYLHFLEYEHLDKSKTSHLEKALADFTPFELQLFIDGNGFILSSNYVVITSYAGSEMSPLHVFARAEWDQYLAEKKVISSNQDSALCSSKKRNYCWGIQIDKRFDFDPQYFLLGMLVLVGSLATLLIFTIWKSTRDDEAFNEKQQLVMQTLAHELRHPVTGFRLSMESIRPHYDNLPEEVMSDFLRLASISERMTRLVKFSQQYLQLLSRDRQFEFQKDNISSFQDFLEVVLENYAGKFELRSPAYDTGCTIDGYWVSTCITNLVVNALTHGKPPVVVQWQRNNKDLLITVEDHGEGPSASLSELVNPQVKKSTSGGMGLGVSLIYRLVSLMNGKFTLQKNPTRFTIALKGVCHD